jgi:hypothetical protein
MERLRLGQLLGACPRSRLARRGNHRFAVPVLCQQYPYYATGYDYGYAGYPRAGGGDSSAYCGNTYRSYDPASGTYLGYDGMRHPCP